MPARSMRVFASHFFHGAGFEIRERSEKTGYQRKKIGEAIRFRSENYNPEEPAFNVLLLRKSLVDRDQRVEPTAHRVEKIAIVQITPAHLCGSVDIVIGQAATKTLRHACVEEHSHDGRRGGSSRHGFGEERGFR